MMDLKTNVQRVENMIYNLCGCTIEEGEFVLNECLKRNRIKKEEKFENEYGTI